MAAVKYRPELRGPWMQRSSTAFVMLIGAASLFLGFVGIDQYVHAHPGLGTSTFDMIYYDLQLFVLSSPPVDGGTTFPLVLQIARFAAPFVTVYTIFEAGRRMFASELALRRLRRCRGHDVVCGSGPVAEALVARLQREGHRTVHVADHGRSVARGRDAWLLAGDPASAEILRAAGVPRAQSLYACTRDASANLAIALAVSALPRRGHGVLHVQVEIDDPELCLALQARRLGLPSSPALHVNFFCVHELAARTLVRTHLPLPPDDQPLRVMVIGASAFGGALIVELARAWRDRPGRTEPLDVTLVDPDAAAEISRLCRRYLFLASTCRFTAYEVKGETLLDGDLPDKIPDRVYLCGADEEASLKLALTMDQFWHRGPRTVVVRLSRLGPLGEAFHTTQSPRLLDDVSGSVYLYDGVRAGTDADLAEDSLVDRLGRAIHENYLAARMAAGAESDELTSWIDLSDEMRAANRAQAADIGRKLRAIGCALAPSPIWGQPAHFDHDVIERLARLEHARWCTYMGDVGWTYGPIRDNDAKVHPDIVEWSQLSAGARIKDREAVCEMPTYLADAGFQIVRVQAGEEARVPTQRRG